MTLCHYYSSAMKCPDMLKISGHYRGSEPDGGYVRHGELKREETERPETRTGR